MKALVLVDIQRGLTKRKDLYNEKGFLDAVNSAINAYRDSNSKIIFLQHTNKLLQEGTSEWEIDSRIDKQEHDLIIQKKHGNGFQKTNLKQMLLDLKIDSITVGGLVSHGCVKATCLGGLAGGFETSLLKHGHTNWNRDAEHNITLTEKELIEKGVLLDTVSDKSLYKKASGS